MTKEDLQDYIENIKLDIDYIYPNKGIITDTMEGHIRRFAHYSTLYGGVKYIIKETEGDYN